MATTKASRPTRVKKKPLPKVSKPEPLVDENETAKPTRFTAKANIGRNQLIYYKKDKFAAIRQAKLRLSNIKLEELTQVLRGKSKWIKH